MKILYITTISLTINSFFKSHIEMFVKEGHSVDIACNCTDLEIDSFFDKLGCKSYQIDFSRSPVSTDNIKAYAQLKRLLEHGGYDIVHCHTPNASMITRLVCKKFRRKNGLKVFYTAHGFHFYKGAKKLNWMIFYPIEKFCARFTDKLITINKEDYELAKAKFKAKEVLYVPGVGVDFSRFFEASVDKAEKRKELGIPQNAFLLFSVGELNENKNHKLVINALEKIDNPDIHYAIAGVGEKEAYLLGLSKELNISEKVHLLSYRTDVMEIYKCADVFVFPSIREGLSVSLMEAMASGLPVVCSRIRGNVDLIGDGNGFLFSPFNVDECKEAIESTLNCNLDNISENNRKKIIGFSQTVVLEKMRDIYGI